MKRIAIYSVLILLLGFGLQSQTANAKRKKPLVQLCLIIDVSGSMNALLLQAQTQIWGLLDYVSEFQLKNKHPDVEIAVLILGDFIENGKPVQIKIVSNFTKDFAQLADQMFLLQTGGGNEFFGEAIDRAINELNWQEKSEFKSIIVAGNETFAQGTVNYEQACKKAFEKGVLVNTIFCGKHDEGEKLLWKRASELGGGEFTNMPQDNDSLNLETPFDDNIYNLYQKYMATYDHSGKKAKVPAIANGKISPVYRNMILGRMKNYQAPKDLIDIFEDSNWDFDAIQSGDVPDQLKDLDKKQLQEYLVKTTQRRSNALEGLKLYQKKIEEFLNVKLGEKSDRKTLDLAAKEIISKQLIKKGFVHHSN